MTRPPHERLGEHGFAFGLDPFGLRAAFLGGGAWAGPSEGVFTATGFEASPEAGQHDAAFWFGPNPALVSYISALALTAFAAGAIAGYSAGLLAMRQAGMTEPGLWE